MMWGTGSGYEVGVARVEALARGGGRAVVPSLDQSQEPRMHPWGQKAQLQAGKVGPVLHSV